MKWIAYILLLFSLARDIKAQPEPPLNEWQALGATPFDARRNLIEAMAPEHKLKLINAIKEDVDGRNDTDLLLHLGDKETIGIQADLAVHGSVGQSLDALNLLATCRDPRAIEAVAPVLFLKAETTRAAVATRSLMVMIPKTPGFNSEVYQWSEDVRSKSIVGHIELLILREWWKANAIHFQRKDYMAVKPGALPPEGGYEPYMAEDGTFHLRKLPGAPDWSPVPALVTSSAIPLPSRPEIPPITTPAPARDRIEPPQTATSRTNYVLMAILVVLLSAVLVFYRKRNRL